MPLFTASKPLWQQVHWGGWPSPEPPPGDPWAFEVWASWAGPSAVPPSLGGSQWVKQATIFLPPMGSPVYAAKVECGAAQSLGLSRRDWFRLVGVSPSTPNAVSPAISVGKLYDLCAALAVPQAQAVSGGPHVGDLQAAAWQGPNVYWKQPWLPYAYETSGPNAWKTYGWWLHTPTGKTYRKVPVSTYAGAWYWQRFEVGPWGSPVEGPGGKLGTWWIVCNALPNQRKWGGCMRGDPGGYPPVEPGGGL